MRIKRVMMVVACVLAVGIAGADVADAKSKGKNCKKLCKSEIRDCRDECSGLSGRERRDCRKECKADILAACEANPDPNTCLGTTTTTTTAAQTTTTLPYGSASRAFLDSIASLLQ